MPANASSIVAETLSLCEKHFSEIVRGAEERPRDHHFGALEVAIWAAVMKIGAFLFGRICGLHSGFEGDAVQGHRDVGDGSHLLEYKGKRHRMLHSEFGPIVFSRAYYHSKNPQDSRWPRDEELGLLPRQNLSPGIEEKLAYLSTVTGSYDQAARTLAKFLPVDLAYKRAQRECRKLGAEIEAAEKEQVQAVFEVGHAPPPPEESAPEAVQVCVDGITVPQFAGGSMEIKVGRVDLVEMQPAPPPATPRPKPERGERGHETGGEERQNELADLKESREQRQYQAASKLVDDALTEVAPERSKAPRLRKATEHSTYRATARLGVEAFGRSLWLAAQALGIQKAVLVLFLADGGKWCWEICKLFFPGAVQILDVFHLARHLVEASNAIWGVRSPQALAWRKDILIRILCGGVKEVIVALEGLTFTKEAARKARAGLLTYLKNNRDRVDYPRYIDAGYPIGSAMIEGACRHVIGHRMKGSGRHWDESGADAMARLRAVECSGRWDRHFRERMQRRLQALRELRAAA